jgi:hypothetical protein
LEVIELGVHVVFDEFCGDILLVESTEVLVIGLMLVLVIFIIKLIEVDLPVVFFVLILFELWRGI